MDMRNVQHQALVNEWKERILAQRNSGQSVRQWCENNGEKEANCETRQTGVITSGSFKTLYVVFALLRDLLGSIVPLIVFRAAWDLFGCYSENYGNVLWMFGAWIIMIGAAVWYARRKGMRREKAGAV